MSAPVDVLAVMDQTSRVLRRTLVGMPRDVEAARAAVAELIEADSDYHVLLDSMRSHPAGHTQNALNRAEKRCAAALARVKGGAA